LGSISADLFLGVVDMKNLSLKICLAIAALLASVESGVAIGQCEDNPKVCSNQQLCIFGIGNDKSKGHWDNFFPQHTQEAKRRGLYPKTRRSDGFWICGAKNTQAPNTLLIFAFKKLFPKQRKQLQSNLKDLGFYRSSIDGLYGKGTAGALTAYNKQNFYGANLKKSENVEQLFNALLGLKSAKGRVAITPTQNVEIISASSGSGFATDLPPCAGESMWSGHSCFGSWVWDDGNKYIGEFKNNNQHGQGTYTFADGSKNVGEFKDGKLDGYVISYSSDGSILKEGIWQDDEFQYPQKISPPVAVVTTPSQDDEATSTSDLPPCPLSGTFHNCVGTYTFEDGQKYTGEWKNDQSNGQGVRTYPNGDKYVGEYKDGKRNGQGTFTFDNRNKYVGGFKDGKRNGHGTFTYADGDKYVGEYRGGKMDGHGTFTYADGDKYVGEYRGGKRNGQFRVTYTNGDRYVGEFVDDERSGHGIYTFGDGSKEVGDFKDGKLNGYAVKYSLDGSILKEGIWKDDEFQ
jgi:hypothetical protein